MAIVKHENELLVKKYKDDYKEYLGLIKIDSQYEQRIIDIETLRDKEIQEIYRFSYGVCKYDKEINYGCDPFREICKLLACNRVFDRKIARCYKSKRRLEDLFSLLQEGDRAVLQTALFSDVEVYEHELLKIVHSNRRILSKLYTL